MAGNTALYGGNVGTTVHRAQWARAPPAQISSGATTPVSISLFDGCGQDMAGSDTRLVAVINSPPHVSVAGAVCVGNSNCSFPDLVITAQPGARLPVHRQQRHVLTRVETVTGSQQQLTVQMLEPSSLPSLSLSLHVRQCVSGEYLNAALPPQQQTCQACEQGAFGIRQLL